MRQKTSVNTRSRRQQGFDLSSFREPSIEEIMDEESSRLNDMLAEGAVRSFFNSSISANVVEMARQHLLEYEDIDDAEFEVCPEDFS